MNHEVLLFARFRELAGAASIQLTLPVGATVAELKRVIAKRWPPMAELVERCAVAVNGEYADLGQSIEADDEIALIPPVSGGQFG
jgi:MoaE-MoaD fusion protein